ncbi:hypothetical protein [Petropleomorpha daqingensis]|uniref:Polysaccharide biosynthesis protein n=1 Tax=Petropleomorpha daqingensis TaxID=2026353 RepID=A0A853CEM8_9ACTN|nr:hypothetical protein [Petropleomorpha daqingensis]NYJ05857.1 hypothetical protein [Petropleomorpha daqingensis]
MAVPVSTLIAASLAHAYPEVAAINAAGFTAYGLSAAWYFVGLGDSKSLTVNESVVRLVATGLSCIALAIRLPLAFYPLLLLLAWLVSTILNARTTKTPAFPVSRTSFSDAFRQVKDQRASSWSRLTNSAYFSGGLSVYSLTAGRAAVTSFAAFDRVQKSAVNAGVFFPQALAGWVAAPALAAERHRRMRLTVALDAAFATLFFFAIWLSLPLVSTYLFGRSHALSPVGMVLCALSAALIIFSRSVRLHVFVPLGRERFAAHAISVMSCLGLIGLALAGRLLGTTWAFVVIVASETLLLAVLGLRLLVGKRELTAGLEEAKI